MSKNNIIKKEMAYPDWKQSIFIVFSYIMVSLPVVLLWVIINRSIELSFHILSLLHSIVILIFIKYLLKKASYGFADLFKTANNNWVNYIATVFLVIGSGIIASEINNYFAFFFPELFAASDSELISSSSNIILVIVTIVILPSILEEIFFRGILLKGLLKNYNYKFSIIFSSFLFAVAHLSVRSGIPLFLGSIIIGYLYWRYRSLFLVIFAHAINNSMYLISIYVLEIPGYSFKGKNIFQPLWFNILGLILFFFSLFIFKMANNSRVQVFNLEENR
ncbi:CPBP family intramembrane glutamic endopeptidase [Natronospora cellulosivora (SeqCode)]